MRRLIVGTMTGILFASLGCGDGGPAPAKLYSVSGKVTVGGKPLTDCTVQFAGIGKEAAYSSKIAADGSYSLVASQDARSGAEAGKYKIVFIQSADAAMKAMMAGGPMSGPPTPGKGLPFPPEYALAETSPKEVEVKAESNTINIDVP